jgi:hypothetical protein
VDAFGLLNHWRSASTKLFLKLSCLSGVSFVGPVRVTDATFPLTLRFSFLDEAASADVFLGVSLLGVKILRTSLELPRNWLVCVCEPDLSLVLSELSELKNFDDFDLISTLEQ